MSEMGMSMMGTGIASGDERATKAANAAISSPLLDDINLKGAKGILVNMTAGLDMGIHEFEEVGAAVREFAHEDATVVVGTVIDPEMSDEIRVTLVATGLDKQGAELKAVPAEPTSNERLRPVELEQPRVAMGGGNAAPSYDQQQQATGTGGSYLDIPAFLRNQAD
ncbi:Cell division protein FtsZ [Nymphon striatum]|nr:Cell division protein FtsZ [Nymphon striatum]